MSDLARQAAERIAPHCQHKSVGEVQRMIEADGVLVSHEDAELLRRITCRDPLTLEKAVEVMGREPDESGEIGCHWMIGEQRINAAWFQHSREPRCMIQSANSQKPWKVDNPTAGQFACLVLAAKMGEQA